MAPPASVSSFGFLEVLLNARDSEPLSVVRAVMEGEAFVKHHEMLVTYVKRLLITAQQETERALSEFQSADATSASSTTVGEETPFSSPEQRPSAVGGRPAPSALTLAGASAAAAASPLGGKRKVSIKTPESYSRSLRREDSPQREPRSPESPSTQSTQSQIHRNLSTTQIQRVGSLRPTTLPPMKAGKGEEPWEVSSTSPGSRKSSYDALPSFEAAPPVEDAPARPTLPRLSLIHI